MFCRIYEFEEANNIDVKFMFPSFELTNWYAAQQLLNTLKGKFKRSNFAIFELFFNKFSPK
jgi:hypothetical protein